MKRALLFLLLIAIGVRPTLAQNQKLPEGIWQGYDGEWLHVSQQLIALAEATPEEKFSWRPAPGVRSTSEVYMHIADREATVDGMYLRIIVHANEHMGQLIAYARTSGIAPPWSNGQ